MPEVNIRTADARALHIEQHFAVLQLSALLYLLERGLGFGDPELVRWIRIDADIGLARFDLGRRHGGQEIERRIQRQTR